MPQPSTAPYAGRDVRKEEPDDCPYASEGETDCRACEDQIDSKASSKGKICVARISGVFLEKMRKYDALPETDKCAFEEYNN